MEPPTHPAKAYPKGEAPTCVGIIVHPKSESDWTRIVIIAIPGPVIIARTVDHNPTVNIGVGVSGKITHVNHFRRRFINIGVFDVVHRAFGRNIVYLVGS
jgi:hypothetical protein